MPNSSEPNLAKATPGRSRTSVVVLAATLALLALLVWFLNPRQPNYKPAPLEPPSPQCPNPGRAFVPTDITEISDPLVDALPQGEKNKAVFRLNMVACSCGCNLSLAACRRSNQKCVTAQEMFKKTIDETVKKTGDISKAKRP